MQGSACRGEGGRGAWGLCAVRVGVGALAAGPCGDGKGLGRTHTHTYPVIILYKFIPNQSATARCSSKL